VHSRTVPLCTVMRLSSIDPHLPKWDSPAWVRLSLGWRTRASPVSAGAPQGMTFQPCAVLCKMKNPALAGFPSAG